MRRHIERGASLVEVGLILPLLILISIGLSEIGFLVVDYLTVTNAAREGARTGAAAANFPTADALILQAVEEASCNLRFGELELVRVFKADAVGDPIVGSINEYTPSGSGLACDSPLIDLSCSNGCPWVANGRDRVPPTLDVLGVEVSFSHTSVTGIFPFPTVDWTETAIMQIEPDTRGTQ
ncbi:MAG TPA: TadE/TadG family type IV pilus assembly protein [Acidimicrobiia bacterium]|nr:TadE/TadG family type IV pilus assembly protein [Acidimicrobiia bacterium]